ncbi:hypothetical protein BJ508DRAFT_415596 [Ascobolus immersus RN42]|uniref:Uncharacterized protein n=1 Tax=Ascobolus immersus RN42 TaxID=1160509 RepID=A0A3N4I3E4_ASCIM|nr:hypothetical protein BJ508DRAFT_415596 [Ascobolus immersus RN42]
MFYEHLTLGENLAKVIEDGRDDWWRMENHAAFSRLLSVALATYYRDTRPDLPELPEYNDDPDDVRNQPGNFLADITTRTVYVGPLLSTFADLLVFYVDEFYPYMLVHFPGEVNESQSYADGVQDRFFLMYRRLVALLSERVERRMARDAQIQLVLLCLRNCMDGLRSVFKSSGGLEALETVFIRYSFLVGFLSRIRSERMEILLWRYIEETVEKRADIVNEIEQRTGLGRAVDPWTRSEKYEIDIGK